MPEQTASNFKRTVFACYRGYITQGIVNNLSPLFFVIFQNRFGISYGLISALILCNFITQVATDVLAVRYVDRIGYRRAAVIAHFLAFFGLMMMGILPNILPAPYVGLVIATIINGVGGGLIEVLMFSINPAYDYRHGEFAIGGVDERQALYRRCEAEGVGISVMKAFSGGQLLRAATSPFGQALSEYQCMQYALDKPGVLTVLPGVRNRQDVRRVLGFLTAGPEARDYSVLGTFAPQDAAGVCVYCNHCQPCPAGLDIGLVNKYYDLVRAGDALAKNHYANLGKTAAACVGCGHCDARCPFHVKQAQRMKEICAYFGA